MTVKSIVTNRKKLEQVSESLLFVGGDETYRPLVIKDLLDTADAHPCLGLAAPQIGYLVRAFVMRYEGEYLIVINPEILIAKGQRDYKREGCLSRPGITVKKGRHKRITVKYYNEAGDSIERKFTNLNARVFQHELDHLNGVLI